MLIFHRMFTTRHTQWMSSEEAIMAPMNMGSRITCISRRQQK